MNSATTPILVALVVQLALGLVVFQANPGRKSNQCLLLLSLVAAAWLASLYVAFNATQSETAALAIRQASAAGGMILTVLTLLRVCLRWDDRSWRDIVRRNRLWLLGTVAMVGLCQTDFFLQGAALSVPAGAAPPQPVYGRGVYLFAAWFTGAAIVLVINSIRDLRETTGRKRAELSFVLMSGIVVIVLPLAVTLVLRPFVDPTKLFWFAPFRSVLFSAILAYGIASRKIMEVGVLLRRVLSYLVLTAYLLAVYALVWWLVSVASVPLVGASAESVAHVVAAIVIAFAMAPARGLSQTLADRLFISTRALDFHGTVSKAARILESVTTLRDLLVRFARTISDAVGTDRVLILLNERDGFIEPRNAQTSGAEEPRLMLKHDDPIVKFVAEHHGLVVFEELPRMRRTPELAALISRMRALRLAVAVGIYSRDHLSGVLLLGPRLSRRIYGTAEQSALQVLCGQLAVAIENAQLFTEVQTAKIYNETLLENLTTGVIAAGANERVTVFNNEAGQITGLKPDDVIDQPLSSLPQPLRELIEETLSSGERREHEELLLDSGSSSLVVRASSSIFHGESGQILGALMVLTDITALKRLEMQIRRSDRLASLGTLSAGMAHEIKNPLVSIKTFAQLLPERYQDPEFRDTFSNLIGHEIDRIDSLVNQLLRFARPAKPLLKPMHVHEVLEKSLMLVGHRLYQKEIKLSRSWSAEVDTLRADADQLEQVFLNFFLNAMDAMRQGGELTVATKIERADELLTSTERATNKGQELLRITIRDNGEGIREEDIAHVFDPFFTTKDYGTGLGLSVVHGIIEEHGGTIEVESELAKGTAFHIALPLVRLGEEVAAA